MASVSLFHKSNFKAAQKVQYIHSDLSGPQILSLGKMRWFITFMCDLTRYKWVHMLPSKESKYVFQKIGEWVKIVEWSSDHPYL